MFVITDTTRTKPLEYYTDDVNEIEELILSITKSGYEGNFAKGLAGTMGYHDTYIDPIRRYILKRIRPVEFGEEAETNG